MANTNAAKKSVEINEEPVLMQVVKNDETPVVEIPKEPELTLEQKITKVEDLSMLIDKWRKLQESYRNLPPMFIWVPPYHGWHEPPDRPA